MNGESAAVRVTHLCVLVSLLALGLAACGDGEGAPVTALLQVSGLDERPDNVACIAPAREPGPAGDNVPELLSETGCLNTSSPGAPPLLSLIPYGLNAGFWSD